MFEKAKEKVLTETKEDSNKGIGTLSEKTLHRILKYYFEPFGDNHEIKIANYFADIVGENGIIEIQTQSFNRLKSKLTQFLEVCAVTLVYPIAIRKKVIVINENGEHIKSYTSPLKGSKYNLFDEIFYIKELLTNKKLTICLVLLNVTEYRTTEKKHKGRRKHEKLNTIPDELVEEIYINGASGYKMFLSDNLPDGFVSRDLSNSAKIPLHRAQTMLNILTSIGTVERIGKSGNSYTYRTKE